MIFRVRGQDEPENVVEFWLEPGSNGEIDLRCGEPGKMNWRLITFRPDELAELIPNRSDRLGIPLDDKGRIQIVGQELTASQRHADEMRQVLERCVEDGGFAASGVKALLAKIREAEDAE